MLEDAEDNRKAVCSPQSPQNHSNSIKAIADAPSETMVTHTRLSMITVVATPLLAEVEEADAADDEEETEDDDDDEIMLFKEECAVDDAVPERESPDAVVEFAPDPPKLGAATAFEGSLRAPVPHGMASSVSG